MEWKLATAPGRTAVTQSETSDDVMQVRAVIASLDEIDHDGDTYSRGSFMTPNSVVISPWNHSSGQFVPPVGQGHIVEEGGYAILIGEVWTDTQAGRDTAVLLRRRGAAQQWSYGFDVLDSRPVKRNGRTVRQITRIQPHEASPVWVAAGVGTRTLTARAVDTAVMEQAARNVAEYRARQMLQRSHMRLIASGLER